MATPKDYQLRDFAETDSAAIYRINDSEIPNVTLFAAGELSRLAEKAAYFRGRTAHVCVT